ncbi:MAG: DUF4160 domain-containing protein [Candidatus Sumerlaeota bacterium]|nr:DUF4160 domain-containing protein [Candidatus Sumerlaeota bacterium]
MPVVFRNRGYRFFFYCNEGNPLEPIHIHVRNGERSAKFWLEPEISIAESYEMSSSELRRLMDVIKENKRLIQEYWNDFFNIEA